MNRQNFFRKTSFSAIRVIHLVSVSVFLASCNHLNQRAMITAHLANEKGFFKNLHLALILYADMNDGLAPTSLSSLVVPGEKGNSDLKPWHVFSLNKSLFCRFSDKPVSISDLDQGNFDFVYYGAGNSKDWLERNDIVLAHSKREFTGNHMNILLSNGEVITYKGRKELQAIFKDLSLQVKY